MASVESVPAGLPLPRRVAVGPEQGDNDGARDVESVELRRPAPAGARCGRSQACMRSVAKVTLRASTIAQIRVPARSRYLCAARTTYSGYFVAGAPCTIV